MILTGPAIIESTLTGKIVISPLEVGQVNPNSYNVPLGETLLTYDADVIDAYRANPVASTTMTEDGFVLEPGELYLGHTMERVGSDHYVPLLFGRSSVGRLGLFVEITAPIGDIGFHGQSVTSNSGTCCRAPGREGPLTLRPSRGRLSASSSARSSTWRHARRRVCPRDSARSNGLLVDRNGFPLEIGCYEGNKAEKHTILPVIRQFQERHGIEGMVVVADAGMLSADNLDDLDGAGLGFIVGSRVTKAPVDLESHFRWHGDAFTDGQVTGTLTPKKGKNKDNDPAVRAEPAWGRKEHPKSWRAVWAFSAKRFARDNRTLTAQSTLSGSSSSSSAGPGRSSATRPPPTAGPGSSSPPTPSLTSPGRWPPT